MIGFMPTSRSSATSRAKPSFSAGSAIAPPPKRMISVDAWNARMNGNASARIRAFCSGEIGAGARHQLRRLNNVRLVLRNAGLTFPLQGVSRTALHSRLPTVVGVAMS